MVAGDQLVFPPDDVGGVVESIRVNGFGMVRGALGEAELAGLEQELVDTQRRLVDGNLGRRHGTTILDQPDATIDGKPFAHYVTFATEVSPRAAAAVGLPVMVEVARQVLGDQAWLLDYEQFGVVYQDARPGPGSAYSRIGWHTDHQSGPHLSIWPGLAFTLHIDPTSPANGFLRVLPGSHLGGTDGIPLGFERVPGEVAVYAERGDILFHHADLWHAAARATADGDDAVRRHLRGSWHGGDRLDVGHGTDDFVKNARR
ncbi:MAG TPA: phytanoyl-CoA dioxygenase family protein [Acidimicrobiales bacterium]|nr:phytanoyl-CoA dioxygenase family protein [Acidimicrobiales bacterium]